MTTDSKIHEALATLGIGTHSTQADELVADALNELAEMQRENASLREQLRLTNDKMAEQVRQARCEVADNIVNAWLDPSYKTGDDLVAVAKRIRDANAPKD